LALYRSAFNLSLTLALQQLIKEKRIEDTVENKIKLFLVHLQNTVHAVMVQNSYYSCLLTFLIISTPLNKKYRTIWYRDTC